MKRLKRFLSVSVSALMITSVMLTGCGKDSVSTVGENSKVADDSAQVSEGTKEVTSIKWVMFGDDQPGKVKVLEDINKKLSKDYGLNLDIQFEPGGTYNDKLNMMIASKEEFDLCLTTAAWVNMYLPNVSKGAYVDITDMIDKEAPELKKALPDFCFEQAKVNGKIYAIPNYQIGYSSSGFQVKKSIAEKYNFDIESVKKYEDLEPLLQKIKENEPGTYPVCTEISNLDYNNDYIVVDNDIKYKANDANKKCDWFLDEDKVRDTLLNKWWKAGFIRADKATIQDDNADQKSGKYAVYAGCVIKPGGEVERQNKTGGTEQYVQKRLATPYISSVAMRSTMTAVSSSSKHPEKAVKMIGVMSTDAEIYNKINFGLEGTSYTKKDNKIVKKEDADYWLNCGWAIGNQFIAYLMEGQQDGIWEETDKINREATVSPISGFSFNQEPVNSEIAKIAAVKEEYKNMAYFDNFEKLFDEYKAKLEQAGLSKYIAEVQKQLDDWSKANGK